MRTIPFYPLVVLLLIGLGGYLGCDPNSVTLPLDGDLAPAVNSSSTASYSSTIPDRTNQTVLVGSFNLQRLGPTKLGNPWVMEKFAEIIRRFDVIALQEITSVDQRTLPMLVEQVNRLGARYSYTISPRIGRDGTNGYFEQYAFVFDTARITGHAELCYVVEDQQDVMHREPFVGRFETRSSQPFNFTLINVHTDPDEIHEELDVLAIVFQNVRTFEYPEDDIMLLGDLNAAPGKLQALERIPGILPVIQGVPTNSRQNKTLDNILVDRQLTREFTGRAGVIDVAKMFQLQLEDSERISDHLPIWAEFTITEASGVPALAAGGNTTVR